ncbi:MAG: hypothetical protein VYE22_36290 [Myxococcota bacterium]|nr:hypothetical protein [Myxococcota bacterium]
MTAERAREPGARLRTDNLVADLYYEDTGTYRRMELDQSLYELEVMPVVRLRPRYAADGWEAGVISQAEMERLRARAADEALDAIFVEVVGEALETDGWGRSI